MSVGILVVTHGSLGSTMVETATNMLGFCPLQVETLEVDANCDPDSLLAESRKLVDSLDSGDGVLVLTDMYGSTPGNIASRLLGDGRTKVVTGINLPMLVRILNYPRLGLDELCSKAVSGGRDGVVNCRADPGAP